MRVDREIFRDGYPIALRRVRWKRGGRWRTLLILNREARATQVGRVGSSSVAPRGLTN